MKKFGLLKIKMKKKELTNILDQLKKQREALIKEIELFRKKGGHIYSIITSNFV